ncbi:MAG: 5-(carboxyamino)imidazole ribonucleotide mutase [Clostridia bacterium]|nr:5-(carboxyamino)imidazole ribonucleotide mutase [Clostridia bacterium]
MKKVGILMGSDSDLPILEKTANILNEFEVPFEMHVYSAHRTPEQAIEFALKAEENGFGVLICAAGMAAHLAGVVAGHTTLPVIGIPCKSTCLDGMDALLSTVMMPSGIPVATVAINGGANAGILAVEMLAISDKDLALKLKQKRQNDTIKVLEKNKNIEEKFNK